MRKGSLCITLLVTLLIGISPLAADTVIRRGIDVFTTTFDGSTYQDFAENPIPAGFFCKRSEAFTGRVAFKGLPLETGAPGQLGNADTVVERLDDAVFDAQGTAVTRIRFRALSLVSIAPIKTACGAFHVYVSLVDKQRVTTMRIFRTHKNGGSFVAPLAVNMRLSFIPVKPPRNKSPRTLELTRSITFPGRPIPWSRTGSSTKQIGSAFVDTNGDLNPDTLLFGTSNFWPGWRPRADNAPKSGECQLCQFCQHYIESEGHWHCTYVETCPPDYCI